MNEILLAANRIKNHIKNTPVISDQKLNEELGAQIFFKMENQQETNSFKARGAFNAILSYKEKHGKFPEKIVIGIDAKDGFVATEGWVNSSEIFVIELAKRYANCGAAAIIYTDIERDGTLSGADIDGTRILAQNLKIPVIASGGISNLEDILKIKALEKNGVVGAIVGRALYDKKILAQDLVNLI